MVSLNNKKSCPHNHVVEIFFGKNLFMMKNKKIMEKGFVHLTADSDHFGHRFRSKSDTHSDPIRTPIPIDIGQLDRSVSDARYFLILV